MNSQNQGDQQSPVIKALIISSVFVIILNSILFPLLGVAMNIILYHRSSSEGLMFGLILAILFDIAIIVSIPIRIRKLK